MSAVQLDPCCYIVVKSAFVIVDNIVTYPMKFISSDGNSMFNKDALLWIMYSIAQKERYGVTTIWNFQLKF